MNIVSIIGCITGILGFIISLINLAYFLLSKRKKINVRFGKMTIRDSYHGKNALIIQYFFENQSQLPVSITRIQFCIDGHSYDCDEIPTIVEQKISSTNGEVYDREVIKSSFPPFNLSSLAAKSGFLLFAIPKDMQLNPDKDLIFRICTNRGKAVQKTFVPHEDSLIC